MGLKAERKVRSLERIARPTPIRLTWNCLEWSRNELKGEELKPHWITPRLSLNEAFREGFFQPEK